MRTQANNANLRKLVKLTEGSWSRLHSPGAIRSRKKIVDIAGCWKKAKGEFNAWISKDCDNIGVSGLSGDLDNLVGASNWT